LSVLIKGDIKAPSIQPTVEKGLPAHSPKKAEHAGASGITNRAR
jgi:hypothetical protein